MSRKMHNQESVRLALAGIYRQLEQQSIQVDRASCMIRCALAISQVLNQSDMEKRLEVLEQLHSSGRAA